MNRRYLGPEEIVSIIRMRGDGLLVKSIAQQFGICEATVSNIINGKRRGADKRKVCPPAAPQPDPEPVIADFSKLPNHVLFKHVSARSFIG